MIKKDKAQKVIVEKYNGFDTTLLLFWVSDSFLLSVQIAHSLFTLFIIDEKVRFLF